jgi:hypothetical protein
MSQDHNHLNHAPWECKYHVVFTPKYRKKVLFGGHHAPLVRPPRGAALPAAGLTPGFTTRATGRLSWRLTGRLSRRLAGRLPGLPRLAGRLSGLPWGLPRLTGRWPTRRSA